MPSAAYIPDSFIRPRRINVYILLGLMACCFFFAGYDLLAEKVWWSTVAIYIPCLNIFGLGLSGWLRMKKRPIELYTGMMGVVNLFLLIYGGWLSWQGEWLWGPLTLGFILLTAPLTWSGYRAVRILRNP